VFSLRERRAKAAEQAALRERFKVRLKVAFGLGDADTVCANEIVCRDPGCPDVETVVLIMRPGGKTQAIKIPGPMAHVSDLDLMRAAADARQRITAAAEAPSP
jgi:hypothetical protein